LAPLDARFESGARQFQRNTNVCFQGEINHMSAQSVGRSGERKPSIAGAFMSAFAIAGVVVSAIVACSSEANTAPSAPKVVYGPSQSLGQGSARVYVTLNAAGKPQSLGVALSEAALTALPQTPLPGGGMSAATLSLALPAEAKVTGFDHAMLDWNPMGHEPDMVYTLPHFDFHFYTVSEAAVMAIMPTDPEFAAKLDKMPAEQYRPVGDIKFPGGVPMMGAHWGDPTSPELQPPPNNKTFTRTFLYGSYDGHFIFWEPMITKAHIESLKTASGGVITTSIKLPTSYEKPGYYPTAYTIQWNASAKEYRIALDSLVQRN
jgi:hypothetical protein